MIGYRIFFPVRDTRPARTKKYKQVQLEVVGGFAPSVAICLVNLLDKISSFYNQNALFLEMKIARRGEK